MSISLILTGSMRRDQIAGEVFRSERYVFRKYSSNA